MINIPIYSLWQGKVGLNEEKYIKPAIETWQGLMIVYEENGEIMQLSPEEVQSKQVGRSERKFKDKFGRPDYYLVYYNWKPTAKQGVML